MSRWFTPRAMASSRPALPSSGVAAQKAAPPRMATLLSCSVRPRRRRSMTPKLLAEGEPPAFAVARRAGAFEPLADDGAPLLEIAVRERLHRLVEAEAGLH